ncbi:MAG: serine hydrolase domain-containing protein [Paracoccaceae bacterium]
MFTRRKLIVSSAATLALPGVLRAQADPIRGFFEATPQMHSLQVQSGDDVIFTATRPPGDLNRFANIKSVSKSVLSLLLGTAFDRGEIPANTSTIGELAPALLPRDATPGAADITVQDLVTLRAGLERTSGPNYGAWVNSPNWVADALARPMIAEPGARMLYSTGSTHILGAVLSEVTGKSLLTLTRERLGQPLGMEIPPWTRDPQGYYMGGNQMALRPSDMLKLARLVRDNGRFEGTQVVSGNWMLASTQPHTRSVWSGLSYGYGWFLSPSGYVLGRGYGGQIIAAHPERRLAVAITSDPTLPARSNGYFGELIGLLNDTILGVA